MIGAEVPDAALVSACALAVAVFMGLASWALLQLVRLAQLVARIEERIDDHARRIEAVEVKQ